jgi:uncharacterized protein YprB with RNaseH-like and TPR domain
MASLRDRLQALRGDQRRNPETLSPSDFAGAGKIARSRAPEPSGWEKAGDFVFRREETIRLPGEILDRVLYAADFFLDGPKPEKLLWYDTETTGLSGGAGTYIFLYGSARIEEGAARLTQLFLADFPGERAFLAGIMKDFSGEPVMLSYNGRAFDGPLLKNRFILNRMTRFPGAGGDNLLPRQFDLLFTARRLWKNILPDCSLGSIEKHILGKTRAKDIPGALIPQVYFAYLAGEERGGMENVVSHHRDDIISLIRLFARYGEILKNPAAAEGLQPAALGIMIEERRPGGGLPLLKDAARRGNFRAFAWLSRYYKQRGAFAEAEKLWIPLAEKNAWAALEMAKYLEHHRADYEGALDFTEKLLAKADAGNAGGNPALSSAALNKRRDRLRKKIRPRG